MSAPRAFAPPRPSARVAARRTNPHASARRGANASSSRATFSETATSAAANGSFGGVFSVVPGGSERAVSRAFGTSERSERVCSVTNDAGPNAGPVASPARATDASAATSASRIHGSSSRRSAAATRDARSNRESNRESKRSGGVEKEEDATTSKSAEAHASTRAAAPRRKEHVVVASVFESSADDATSANAARNAFVSSAPSSARSTEKDAAAQHAASVAADHASMSKSYRESSVRAFTGSFAFSAAEAANAAIANAARSDGAAARDRARTRKPLSRARRATTSAARVACKTTRSDSDSFAVESRIESIVSSKESNRVDTASSTRRRTSSRSMSSSSDSPNANSPSARSAAAIDSGGTSSTGRLAAATSAETSGGLDGECAGTISTSSDMFALVHVHVHSRDPKGSVRRQSRDGNLATFDFPEPGLPSTLPRNLPRCPRSGLGAFTTRASRGSSRGPDATRARRLTRPARRACRTAAASEQERKCEIFGPDDRGKRWEDGFFYVRGSFRSTCAFRRHSERARGATGSRHHGVAHSVPREQDGGSREATGGLRGAHGGNHGEVRGSVRAAKSVTRPAIGPWGGVRHRTPPSVFPSRATPVAPHAVVADPLASASSRPSPAGRKTGTSPRRRTGTGPRTRCRALCVRADALPRALTRAARRPSAFPRARRDFSRALATPPERASGALAPAARRASRARATDRELPARRLPARGAPETLPHPR